MEIFGSFETQVRSRSHTWPPPSPENSPTDKDSSLQGQTPGLKKSTSRRNAWGNMSYADLITQAIQGSEEKRLTLSQIYEWMVQHVPYFKDKGDNNSSAGWKNSIRHNLSLHNRFMRVQNEGTGKSSWWMINPDAKPGKSPRRRATSIDGNNNHEKRRGRAKKKVPEPPRIVPTPSPSSSLSENYPESPHPSYQYSPEYRVRSSSASQLSPIQNTDSNGTFEYIIQSIYSPEHLVHPITDSMGLSGPTHYRNTMKEQSYYSEPYRHYPTPPQSSPLCVEPLNTYSDNYPNYYYRFSDSPSAATSLSNTADHVVGHLRALNYCSGTDFDLNYVAVQEGLECDVDQVLRHELSMDGNLDFNFDSLPCQHQSWVH